MTKQIIIERRDYGNKLDILPAIITKNQSLETDLSLLENNKDLKGLIIGRGGNHIYISDNNKQFTRQAIIIYK